MGPIFLGTGAAAEMYLSEFLPQGMGDDPAILDTKIQVLGVLSGLSGITRGYTPES